MNRVEDLSRSLLPFDQEKAVVAVIELSSTSWLVAGTLPGITRRPLKKLEPDPAALSRLLDRWREEAVSKGGQIDRVIVACEAGRDGFWLARRLQARGMETHVIAQQFCRVSRNKGLKRAQTCCMNIAIGNRFMGQISLPVGYARVSRTDAQDLEPHCVPSRRPVASGSMKKEPQADVGTGPNCTGCSMDSMGGDVVVVWKLDRLTRSLKDMLLILEKIEAAGAGFRSLTEAIDTTTSAGRMMMQMLGSFAGFERAIVRERTMAGLQAARECGRKGGRRPKLTADQRSEIIGMLNEGRPAAEIARLFRVHRATVGRIGAGVKIAVR